MGEKKVAIVVLKVDLQCSKCCRKVKKVLCKFPEIQDQVYDENQNTVTIKVVCCSPEKMKQKISSKGGSSIKSIEIIPPKEPQMPNEPEKPKEKLTAPAPEPSPGPAEPPKQDKRKVTFADPANPAAEAPERLLCSPPAAYRNPVAMCCRECYERSGGGPCYQVGGQYGRRRYYDGYYERPVYDSWGGGDC